MAPLYTVLRAYLPVVALLGALSATAQQQDCRRLSYLQLHDYKGKVKKITEVRHKAATVAGQWEIDPANDHPADTTIMRFDENGQLKKALIIHGGNAPYTSRGTWHQVTGDSAAMVVDIKDGVADKYINTYTWLSDHEYRNMRIFQEVNGRDANRVLTIQRCTLDQQCRIDTFSYTFPGMPDGDITYKQVYTIDGSSASYKIKGKSYGVEERNMETILKKDKQGNATRTYSNEQHENAIIVREYEYYTD